MEVRGRRPRHRDIASGGGANVVLNGPPITLGSPKLVKTREKGQKEMLKMIHIRKQKDNDVASAGTGDIHTEEIHIRLTEFPPKILTLSSRINNP